MTRLKAEKSKIILKLIAFVLIQAFLIFDCVWAGGSELLNTNFLKKSSTLAPEVRISIDQFQKTYSNLYQNFQAKPPKSVKQINPTKQKSQGQVDVLPNAEFFFKQRLNNFIPKILGRFRNLMPLVVTNKVMALSAISVLFICGFSNPTLLYFLPIVFGICDRVYIKERLEVQEKNKDDYEEEKRKEEERKKEEEEQRKKELGERAKAFEEALEKFTDKLEEVIDEEGEINRILDDLAKHDIRKYSVRALANLTDSRRLNKKEFTKEVSEVLVREGIFEKKDKVALEKTLNSEKIKDEVDGLIDITQKSFRPKKEKPQEKLFEENGEDNKQSTGQQIQKSALHKHTKGQSGLVSLTLLLFLLPFSVILSYFTISLSDLNLESISKFLISWLPFFGAILGSNINPAGGADKEGLLEETEEDPIKRYTINLNELAGQEKLSESVYIDYIQRLDSLLSRGSKKNVVLVGDPDITRGFIETVAYEVATKPEQSIPENLRQREFLYLNVASLLYLMAEIGRFEATIQELMDAIEKAVKKDGKKYVFIFDFQQIYWIKRERVGLINSISFLFKNILNNREIPVVGLCNKKYYNEFFSSDRESLKKDFEKLEFEDLPDYKVTENIRTFLRRIKDVYPALSKEINRVFIKSETLEKVLDYVRRFMPYGELPNKLEEMIDQVLIKQINRSFIGEVKINNLKMRIQQAISKYQEAKQKNDPSEIRYLKRLLNQYAEKLGTVKQQLQTGAVSGAFEITQDELVNLISEETRIPEAEITQEQDDKLKNYKENIRKRLVGQSEAVDLTYNAFRRRRAGMSQKGKPIGAFIFDGPTGVGKTELAKAIAEQYFGSEDRLIRFDMSEYMQEHQVQKLIGAPPGYIGYEEGGQLTNAVRKNPFTVILFDEIEKAHSSIYDLLLQIFDKAQLTDSHGRTVSFENTIIIMTSNLGMTPKIYDMYDSLELLENMEEGKIQEILKVMEFYPHKNILEEEDSYSRYIIDKFAKAASYSAAEHKNLREKAEKGELEPERLGLKERLEHLNRQISTKKLLETLNTVQIQNETTAQAKEKIREYIRDKVKSAIHLYFARRPELFSRLEAIGDIVVFDKLESKDLEQILEIKLAQKNEALKEKALELRLSPKIKEEVIKQGYEPTKGARPLERALTKIVLAPLGIEILKDNFKPQDIIIADLKDGKVIFEVKREHKEEEDLDTPLVKKIDEKLAKDEPAEDKFIAEIFEIPLSVQKPSALTEEELSLGFPADVDKLVTEFAQSWEKENRRISEEEKEKLIQTVKKQIEAQQELLNKFFTNLSLLALRDEIKPSVLRQEDAAKFIRVLEQNRRNHPFLVNRTTSVLENFTKEFTRQCQKGKVSGYERVRFLKLNLERFSSQFALIGKIEDQMRRFLDAIEKDDAKKNLRTIIVIDYDELAKEIPVYRGGGILSNEEQFNLGFFMIPFIGRGNIRVILTTTKNNISDNEVYSRFFTEVNIEDLNQKESLEKFCLFDSDKIISKADKKLLDFTYQTLEDTASLFDKNLPDEPLLEVLVRYFEYLVSGNVRTKEALATSLVRAKESLTTLLQGYIDDNNLPLTEEELLKNQEIVELVRQSLLLEKKLTVGGIEKKEVILDDAYDFLTQIYNLDKANLTVDEKKNLLELEEHLQTKIIGQAEAIEALGDAVRLGKVGLKPVNKPVGAFLFTGPTGVGKTELVYTLGAELGMPVVRYDMTEFKNVADVSKLIGAPPGYIGHEDTENLLTTKVIKNPKSIILFDEIDKILETGLTKEGIYGKTVLDILLQMLEDGRLTDSHGNIADFSQSIIIFTSNGGVNVVFEPTEEGIEAVIDNRIYDEIKKAVLEENVEGFDALKEKIKERVDTYHRYMLRPEFLNRLDKIVVFNPLKKFVLEEITILLLTEFTRQMTSHYQLVFGENKDELDAIVNYLMSRGFSPEKGARALLGLINKDLKDKLNDFLDTQGALNSEDKIIVKLNPKKDGFEFKIEKKEKISPKVLLNLNELEEIIFNNIASGMNKYEGQFPTLETKDIEPWFLPQPLAPSDKGKIIEFSTQAKTFTLNDNDFINYDEQFKAFLKEIMSDLSIHLDIPDVTKAVKTWITEAVILAQRENIQQTAWKEEGRIYNFYDLESGEIRQVLERFKQEANKNKFMQLSYELKENEFKFEVKFNSRFSEYLYRRLFEDRYETETEITQKANRLLQGLLKASLKLSNLNSEMGFSSDKDTTSLWLKMPLLKSTSSLDNLTLQINELRKQLSQLKEKHTQLLSQKTEAKKIKPGDKEWITTFKKGDNVYCLRQTPSMEFFEGVVVDIREEFIHVRITDTKNIYKADRSFLPIGSITSVESANVFHSLSELQEMKGFVDLMQEAIEFLEGRKWTVFTSETKGNTLASVQIRRFSKPFLIKQYKSASSTNNPDIELFVEIITGSEVPVKPKYFFNIEENINDPARLLSVFTSELESRLTVGEKVLLEEKIAKFQNRMVQEKVNIKTDTVTTVDTWTRVRNQTLAPLAAKVHDFSSICSFFIYKLGDKTIGVSMGGRDGGVGEYLLTQDDWQLMPEKEQTLAPLLRDIHESNAIEHFFTYQFEGKTIGVSMGWNARVGEYLLTQDGWQLISEKEQTLAPLLKEIHGPLGICHFFTYQFEGKTIGVSMGWDGKAGEYFLSAVGWMKIPEKEQTLAPLLKMGYVDNPILFFFTYQFKGKTIGVSMGWSGITAEFLLTENGWEQIPTLKQNLALLLKKVHGDKPIYFFFAYQLGGKTIGVSTGTNGRAGEYLLTQDGWQLIPEKEQTLAPLLKQVHDDSDIHHFLTYQLNNKIMGISVGVNGKAGEFEIRNKLTDVDSLMQKAIEFLEDREWRFPVSKEKFKVKVNPKTKGLKRYSENDAVQYGNTIVEVGAKNIVNPVKLLSDFLYGMGSGPNGLFYSDYELVKQKIAEFENLMVQEKAQKISKGFKFKTFLSIDDALTDLGKVTDIDIGSLSGMIMKTMAIKVKADRKWHLLYFKQTFTGDNWWRQTIVSAGDKLIDIGKIKEIESYSLFSEDKIAAIVKSRRKKHLVLFKYNRQENIWFSELILSTGEALSDIPGIGKITDISNPSLSENKLIVNVESTEPDKEHLLYFSQEEDGKWVPGVVCSKGDLFKGMESSVTDLGSSSISEDRIASKMQLRGIQHLIHLKLTGDYRKVYRPWAAQKIFALGENILPEIGRITWIHNPSFSKDKIAVVVDTGGGSHLIIFTQNGQGKWTPRKIISQGDTIEGIGEISFIEPDSVSLSEDKIAIKVEKDGKQQIITSDILETKLIEPQVDAQIKSLEQKITEFEEKLKMLLAIQEKLKAGIAQPKEISEQRVRLLRQIQEKETQLARLKAKLALEKQPSLISDKDKARVLPIKFLFSDKPAAGKISHVGVDSQDNLYIADADNPIIYKIKPNIEEYSFDMLSQLIIPNPQAEAPPLVARKFAFDKEDNIYVLVKDKVYIYNAKGKLKPEELKVPRQKADKDFDFYDMAIDQFNRVYVLDFILEKQVIHLFETNGIYIKSWLIPDSLKTKTRESPPMQIYFTSLAIDKDNHLLIGNNAGEILRFEVDRNSNDFKYIGKLESPDIGTIDNIFVDKEGNINFTLRLGTYTYFLQAFDVTGRYLGSYKHLSTYNEWRDLAIDKKGHIFMPDWSKDAGSGECGINIYKKITLDEFLLNEAVELLTQRKWKFKSGGEFLVEVNRESSESLIYQKNIWCIYDLGMANYNAIDLLDKFLKRLEVEPNILSEDGRKLVEDKIDDFRKMKGLLPPSTEPVPTYRFSENWIKTFNLGKTLYFHHSFGQYAVGKLIATLDNLFHVQITDTGTIPEDVRDYYEEGTRHIIHPSNCFHSLEEMKLYLNLEREQGLQKETNLKLMQEAVRFLESRKWIGKDNKEFDVKVYIIGKEDYLSTYKNNENALDAEAVAEWTKENPNKISVTMQGELDNPAKLLKAFSSAAFWAETRFKQEEIDLINAKISEFEQKIKQQDELTLSEPVEISGKWILNSKPTLALLLKQAYGDDWIYQFFTYQIGDEIRGVDIGGDGEANEYLLTNNTWQSIPKEQQSLVPLLKEIHGISSIYHFSTYRLNNQTRGVSTGEWGRVGEYLLTENGWQFLPKKEQTLPVLLKQVHGDSGITQFCIYQRGDQIKGVSIGSKGKSGVYLLTKDGWQDILDWKSLPPLLKEIHGNSWIEDFFISKIGNETRGMSMGEEGKVGEYLLKPWSWQLIPKEEQTLAPLLKKIHSNSGIYQFFTYEIDNEIRGVSIGGEGKTGEYLLTNSGWQSIPEEEQILSPLLKQIHGNSTIEHFSGYKIGNEIRAVSVGQNGTAGEYVVSFLKPDGAKEKSLLGQIYKLEEEIKRLREIKKTQIEESESSGEKTKDSREIIRLKEQLTEIDARIEEINSILNSKVSRLRKEKMENPGAADLKLKELLEKFHANEWPPASRSDQVRNQLVKEIEALVKQFKGNAVSIDKPTALSPYDVMFSNKGSKSGLLAFRPDNPIIFVDVFGPESTWSICQIGGDTGEYKVYPALPISEERNILGQLQKELLELQTKQKELRNIPKTKSGEDLDLAQKIEEWLELRERSLPIISLTDIKDLVESFQAKKDDGKLVRMEEVKLNCPPNDTSLLKVGGSTTFERIIAKYYYKGKVKSWIIYVSEKVKDVKEIIDYILSEEIILEDFPGLRNNMQVRLEGNSKISENAQKLAKDLAKAVQFEDENEVIVKKIFKIDKNNFSMEAYNEEDKVIQGVYDKPDEKTGFGERLYAKEFTLLWEMSKQDLVKDDFQITVWCRASSKSIENYLLEEINSYVAEKEEKLISELSNGIDALFKSFPEIQRIGLRRTSSKDNSLEMAVQIDGQVGTYKDSGDWQAKEFKLTIDSRFSDFPLSSFRKLTGMISEPSIFDFDFGGAWGFGVTRGETKEQIKERLKQEIAKNKKTQVENQRLTIPEFELRNRLVLLKDKAITPEPSKISRGDVLYDKDDNIFIVTKVEENNIWTLNSSTANYHVVPLAIFNIPFVLSRYRWLPKSEPEKMQELGKAETIDAETGLKVENWLDEVAKNQNPEDAFFNDKLNKFIKFLDNELKLLRAELRKSPKDKDSIFDWWTFTPDRLKKIAEEIGLSFEDLIFFFDTFLKSTKVEETGIYVNNIISTMSIFDYFKDMLEGINAIKEKETLDIDDFRMPIGMEEKNFPVFKDAWKEFLRKMEADCKKFVKDKFLGLAGELPELLNSLKSQAKPPDFEKISRSDVLYKSNDIAGFIEIVAKKEEDKIHTYDLDTGEKFVLNAEDLRIQKYLWLPRAGSEEKAVTEQEDSDALAQYPQTYKRILRNLEKSGFKLQPAKNDMQQWTHPKFRDRIRIISGPSDEFIIEVFDEKNNILLGFWESFVGRNSQIRHYFPNDLLEVILKEFKGLSLIDVLPKLQNNQITIIVKDDFLRLFGEIGLPQSMGFSDGLLYEFIGESEAKDKGLLDESALEEKSAAIELETHKRIIDNLKNAGFTLFGTGKTLKIWRHAYEGYEITYNLGVSLSVDIFKPGESYSELDITENIKEKTVEIQKMDEAFKITGTFALSGDISYDPNKKCLTVVLTDSTVEAYRARDWLERDTLTDGYSYEVIPQSEARKNVLLVEENKDILEKKQLKQAARLIGAFSKAGEDFDPGGGYTDESCKVMFNLAPNNPVLLGERIHLERELLFGLPKGAETRNNQIWKFYAAEGVKAEELLGFVSGKLFWLDEGQKAKISQMLRQIKVEKEKSKANLIGKETKSLSNTKKERLKQVKELVKSFSEYSDYKEKIFDFVFGLSPKDSRLDGRQINLVFDNPENLIPGIEKDWQQWFFFVREDVSAAQLLAFALSRAFELKLTEEQIKKIQVLLQKMQASEDNFSEDFNAISTDEVINVQLIEQAI